MKKPYIKKYKEVAGFSVWIVDGDYVRANLNEEFTLCGWHRKFKFIPKDELWIAKEYGGDNEAEFNLDSMLIINNLMSKGKSFKEAVKKADMIEKRERKKSEFFKKNIGKINRKKEEIKGVKKKLIKRYSNKIKVWIVNGELVRDLFFLDFTQGGHDKVYHFIPKNEIWIDDDASPNERKFILLHEIHERNLMAKGWGYESAHRDSSRIEYYCRHHLKKVGEAIKKEMKKTGNIS